LALVASAIAPIGKPISRARIARQRVAEVAGGNDEVELPLPRSRWKPSAACA
jgi:hypothetical protein